tara:strand:- start:509 stop:1129 length:621 start_codon:yes stop_codon:yes gene_type:complete
LKKNKISKNWLYKQRNDIYIKRSKLEGYRSRAVYKLEEINKKYKIFKNGIKVVDLGAAPGSWSQYVSKNVKNAKIVAIDLKEIELVENTFFIKGNFVDMQNQKKIKEYFKDRVDVVLSDMAANTTGNKSIDSIVIGELCIDALEFSKSILKNDGRFVSKIFMGSSFNEIIAIAKKIFKEVHIFKPQSSRKESKESFLVCKNLLKYN